MACFLAKGAVATDSGDFALMCTIGAVNCLQCDRTQDSSCMCSRDDFKHWIEEAAYVYEDALTTCAIDSVTGSSYDCLKKATSFAGFNSSCVRAFSQLVDCTLDECIGDCLSRELKDSPECRSCVKRICETKFFQDSGFPTLQCPEEVCPPQGDIIPGLSNTIFFAILGGVGFIGIIGGVICIYMFCLRDSTEVDLGEIDSPYGGSPSSFRSPKSDYTHSPSASYTSNPASPPSNFSLQSSPVVAPPPGLGIIVPHNLGNNIENNSIPAF